MEGLTEEEAAIYDRQLRVWGVEAQQRLRKSRILILGCTGAAYEVTKNLALAGVGTIELVDSRTGSNSINGNFLMPFDVSSGASVSQLCAKELAGMNPLVDIKHIHAHLSEYIDSCDMKRYDAVMTFDMPAFFISKVDSVCQAVNVPFASCSCRGVSGWIFLNPQNHQYIVEEITENENGETVKNLKQCQVSGTKFTDTIKQFVSANPRRKSPMFEALKACINFEIKREKAVSLDDYHTLRSELEQNNVPSSVNTTALYSYIKEESCLPAVYAILGGVLTNDIIKIVSKKGDLSIDKLFMYSILDDGGWTGF